MCQALTICGFPNLTLFIFLCEIYFILKFLFITRLCLLNHCIVQFVIIMIYFIIWFCSSVSPFYVELIITVLLLCVYINQYFPIKFVFFRFSFFLLIFLIPTIVLACFMLFFATGLIFCLYIRINLSEIVLIPVFFQ